MRRYRRRRKRRRRTNLSAFVFLVVVVALLLSKESSPRRICPPFSRISHHHLSLSLVKFSYLSNPLTTSSPTSLSLSSLRPFKIFGNCPLANAENGINFPSTFEKRCFDSMSSDCFMRLMVSSLTTSPQSVVVLFVAAKDEKDDDDLVETTIFFFR